VTSHPLSAGDTCDNRLQLRRTNKKVTKNLKTLAIRAQLWCDASPDIMYKDVAIFGNLLLMIRLSPDSLNGFSIIDIPFDNVVCIIINEVKLSLCLTKHRAIKTYGGEEVQPYTF
jgi:hypothetical protein